MKKSILTLLSVTAICLTHFAQSELKKPVSNTNKINVHKPHKSVNYNWNGTAWTLIDSTEYQYNIQGQVTSSLSRTNGNFTERTSHTYDYLFQPLLETRDVYDLGSSSWKPANKAQMTFNDHFDETLHERSIYNAGNWEIYYGYKYVYQYNTSNQITEKIEYAYIDNVIAYSENEKFSDIVYDNNNNVTQQIISNWTGNQFVYFRKFINTYNPDNTLATRNVLLWNNSTMNWDEEYRETYSYGLNGSYTDIFESYISNSYEIDFRQIIEFDSFHNLTRDYIEHWDNSNSQWVMQQDFQNNSYLYNVNDYMTQEINKIWDDFNMQSINYLRKDYFDFETFDSHLGLESNNEEKISIYPNPMKSECIIDLSELDEKVHAIKLFNTTGNQILSIPVSENQKVVLNNTQLQNGLYLVLIETDSRTIQSTIVVE